MSDYISRADAIDFITKLMNRDCAPCDFTEHDKIAVICYQTAVKALSALPSADAESDDLIIKGAKGIQDGLYNIKDGKLFKYKAKGGTVRTYPIVPSADAEQVTSKLKKPCDSLLTDDSAECKEQKSKLDLISRNALMEYCSNQRSKTIDNNDIARFPSAKAVQGEWVRKVKEYNDCDGHSFVYWYECSVCGARPPKDQWRNEWHSNYCPSCGARMYKV